MTGQHTVGHPWTREKWLTRHAVFRKLHMYSPIPASVLLSEKRVPSATFLSTRPGNELGPHAGFLSRL